MKNQARGLLQTSKVGCVINAALVLTIIAILVALFIPAWQSYRAGAIRYFPHQDYSYSSDTFARNPFAAQQIPSQPQQIYVIQLVVPQDYVGHVTVENRGGKLCIDFSKDFLLPDMLIMPEQKLDTFETTGRLMEF